VVARIFVCPSEDTAAVRAVGRRAIAAYLNVTVYAEFHRWLGRGPALQGMWDAWQAGDRRAALDAISDDLVDQLIVHGSPQACREQIRRYAGNGVTVPVIALIGPYGDLAAALRGLAPGR
jgi:alkanesulfonate monooxygenase SsuD/methylene tetrahydromethanopterin reductase-like flavin-dependent oxidoreductase (luciferase family)